MIEINFFQTVLKKNKRIFNSNFYQKKIFFLKTLF